MFLSQILQPKIITIKRRQNQGFGFTLRHFIAYPPEPLMGASESCQRKAMETIFIKEVNPDGPAYLSGLKTGDRILMVNNMSVAGVSYSTIVSIIKQTPSVLKLQIVPKECDILQMYYTDIAHNPETNRHTIDIDRPLLPITSTAMNAYNNFHSRLISYSPEGNTSSKCSASAPVSDLKKSMIYFGNNEYGLEDCDIRIKQRNLSVLQKTNSEDLLVRLRRSIDQKEIFTNNSSIKKISHLKNLDKEEHIKSSAPSKASPEKSLISPVNIKFKTTFNHLAKNGNEIQLSSKILNKNNKSNYFKNSPEEETSIYQNINELKLSIPYNESKEISKDMRSINSINCLIDEWNNDSLSNFPTLKNLAERLVRSSNIKEIERFRNDFKNYQKTAEVKLENVIHERNQNEIQYLESLPDKSAESYLNESKIGSNLLEHSTKNDNSLKQLSIRTSLSKANNLSIKALNRDIEIEFKMLETKTNNAEFQTKTNNTEFQDTFNVSSRACTDVIRRTKTEKSNENSKPMRRISYLRATNNDISDSKIENHNIFEKVKENTTEKDKQIFKSVAELEFEDHIAKQKQMKKYLSLPQTEALNQKETEGPNYIVSTFTNQNEIINSFYVTEMEMKSSCIYGKRNSEYRSWRQVKVEITGKFLRIYLLRSSKAENNRIELNINNFNVVDETIDKKKFVISLHTKPIFNSDALNSIENVGNATNQYTEIFLKTKNINDMRNFLKFLQQKCDENDKFPQVVEPENKSNIKQNALQENCSFSKETTFNCTVANGFSEITEDSTSSIIKSQKLTNKVFVDKDFGSPKTKNWKDLLFRRIHHYGGNDISSTSININGIRSTKYIGTIGIPLRFCPMSKNNEYIPLIMEICTNIVERKGLQVVGIYRIPGNKAAISELKEEVNKIDFQWGSVETDLRWDDVNVVSSLLKLFIRSLPDALLPGTSYINFIEAAKNCGQRRLKELSYLLKTLPLHSYESMKYIIRHLNRISKNCHVNLMEPKNLAIIFGPSLIRIPNETLDMVVKDMKHQCRIVELFVSQYDFFFENGDLPELNSPQFIASTCYLDQTNLLLDNVSKIQGRLNDKESLTSRLIPHLRKKARSKRGDISSDGYCDESILSLEYKKKSELAIKENISNNTYNRTGIKSTDKNSVEISILLNDEDSKNSRLSDSGSMSLTTITDALDSKLRNLRSGSESTDDASQNNPNKPRKSFLQPLVLYESEYHTIPSNKIMKVKEIKFFPITRNSILSDNQKNCSAKNNQRISSVYESCSDDSEGSTTSDPKEYIVMSPFLLEHYKKKQEYRLFRSASLNCRKYSSKSGNGSNCMGNVGQSTHLTKDEKTDINITKKRQIQNKQNRSIKRRHTVGGPHDFLQCQSVAKI